MPTEIVVPLAALVIGCLLRLAVGRRPTGPAAGPEEAARRFIDARIDEHVDVLAAQHLRASAGGVDGGDDVPPRFANDIQSFIAEVLLHDVVVATGDDEVAGAVRELVVLERGYIYGRIMTRLRDRTSPA